MQIGTHLPRICRKVGPDTIRRVAVQAEELGTSVPVLPMRHPLPLAKDPLTPTCRTATRLTASPRKCCIASIFRQYGEPKMQWDAVQLDAKAKGHLIFGIDQAQTAVLTQPGPWGSAYDGYCIGLSASWISLAYQGKDFPVVDDACDTPPWQATEAQNLSDALKRVEWTDWWKIATTPFRCTLSDGLRATRHTKPTADFLWSIMSQAYGCYGVYLQGSGGAHAIALRHGRDNRYHLFDPNYFHIAIKGKDRFKAYVDSYLTMSGYDKQFEKKTGVVGVRPPINVAH